MITEQPTIDEQTYCIKRHYHPSIGKDSERIKEGLTLEEAQEHCSDPGTACNEYFDAYHAE